MKNFLWALLPVLVILGWIYYQDKYEKEPFSLMALAFLGGILAAICSLALYPILTLIDHIPNKYALAFFDSFLGAAIPEESFKFLFLYWFIWKQKDFNEKFDGILYAVMVAMGFAALENILYLFLMYSLPTAVGRAILAVPGHAFFGVIMGYYVALAKFSPVSERKKHFMLAFIIPILAHGIYNFLLSLFSIVNKYVAIGLSIVFIYFIFWLWKQGFQKIESHVAASPFKESKII